MDFEEGRFEFQMAPTETALLKRKRVVKFYEMVDLSSRGTNNITCLSNNKRVTRGFLLRRPKSLKQNYGPTIKLVFGELTIILQEELI